jgi:SAM-dependent methyltransferase
MAVEFTFHNIRLDDGTLTKPEQESSMENYPWFVSARRVIETVFPGDKSQLRLVDLGCLEGGYAVEFARMGLQVTGIEVRASNMEACAYVKSRVDLPNLSFAKDDALNLASYGSFDIVFCCGLFYHLESPRSFLDTLSSVTKKLLILQTHFSSEDPYSGEKDKFNLSELTEHEGIPGRWYTEFENAESFSQRETAKWAAWDNLRSFWIQREYLLQSIQDVGFDLVMEQFDFLGENLAGQLLHGYYKTDSRGTFIGIKTGAKKDASYSRPGQ